METEATLIVAAKEPTLEEVNKHALARLDELILKASAEEMPGLVDCLSKYNTSIRNNDIFTPDETPDERIARERKEAMSDMLKGQ